MTKFSCYTLQGKRTSLRFVHFLPVLRKTLDRFFSERISYHLHEDQRCYGQDMGASYWHRLRDVHDIIEKRTINIEGHVYAPFYFIS